MTTLYVNKIKNNQNGNPVRINELRGIDTAGSITVQGEGTATTNLQQGLLKIWYSFDLYSSQNTFEGSFNVSSGTDNGTADATGNFTNNMSSQDYTPASSTNDNDICVTQADRTDGKGSRTTSAFKSRTRDHSGGAQDSIHYIHLAGDLA